MKDILPCSLVYPNKELKKALLIVDRGSREPAVRQELEELCSLVKSMGTHSYVDYCFLEVLPPFIPEGISSCIRNGACFITVLPYFLYPGMKLKDTVKQTARICRDKNLRLVITKPLSYHPMLAQMVLERINHLKKKKSVNYADKDCDVVLIGHGSSDRNARDAFVHTAEGIKPYYHKVHYCFLELDQPNIDQGIGQAVAGNPKVLLIVPYFLHEGTHIKKDVINELDRALKKYNFNSAFLGLHLGVDEKLVNIMAERTRDVERRVHV